MRLQRTHLGSARAHLGCPVGAWVEATPPTVSGALVGRVTEVDGPYRSLQLHDGMQVLVSVQDCRHIPEPLGVGPD